MKEKDSILEKIKMLSNSIGINALGFAEASEFVGYPLKNSKRKDPKLSMPDAKTIIVAGIYIGGVTLSSWENPWYGRTSRLFLSEFFLDVVKPLKPIVKYIEKEGYKANLCESGSNLPLKLAAVRAGLGWQGKHSLLISKKYGTFLALGGIITNIDFEINSQEEPDRCRNCDKCQRACPSMALSDPYILNRERCISNSLQSKTLLEKTKSHMVNRIMDCEICQNACPWNKKHIKNPLATHLTVIFQKKANEWNNFFYLPDLANLSNKQYREKLNHLKTEISFDVFHRNVLVALENAKMNRN